VQGVVSYKVNSSQNNISSSFDVEWKVPFQCPSLPNLIDKPNGNSSLIRWDIKLNGNSSSIRFDLYGFLVF
jgi:hypothetical protein